MSFQAWKAVDSLHMGLEIRKQQHHLPWPQGGKQPSPRSGVDRASTLGSFNDAALNGHWDQRCSTAENPHWTMHLKHFQLLKEPLGKAKTLKLPPANLI